VSADKLDERVKQVMGEIRCPYPRPSHEHDELDCRVCALERRIRAALDEAVAEERKELFGIMSKAQHVSPCTVRRPCLRCEILAALDARKAKP